MPSHLLRGSIVGLACAAALALACAASADQPVAYDPADLDAVLQRYVKGGQFQYASLRANPKDLARLERYLKWQETAPVKQFARADQIAFYINAYNVLCIKLILDHYPVAGPMDPKFGKEGAKFFKETKFTVAGEQLSVTEVEYDRLIANYLDMRAHFAVVCSDRGCMALRAAAWRGADLDEQLDLAARRFLNDPSQFQVDPKKKTVRISKIFDWYGPKFLEDPRRPVPGGKAEQYMLHWLEDDAAKALLKSGDYTLEFIEWDWSLNETPVGETAYDTQDLDHVLRTYVTDGAFDYPALRKNAADMARLERYLAYQAKAPVAKFSWADQVAFYINAYNVCCIKLILDAWPVSGPMDPKFGKDGAKFFKETKFTVAGEQLSVTEMEYDRLIANYRDMRAHFAVNCADRGCLPLRGAAWRGADLDAELEAAARRFLADPTQWQVDHEARVVRISKIFDWYGPKFLRDPRRPVDGHRPELYLLPWVDEATRKLLASGDYQLKFIEWDWNLNRPRNQ